MVTLQEYKAKRASHPTLMKIMNGSDDVLRAESLATRNPRYVMPTQRFDTTYRQEANSKLEARAQNPIVGEDYKTDYLTQDLYSMHKTRVKPLVSETLTIPQDDSYAKLQLSLAHMDKTDGKITQHDYNAEHMLVTDLVQRYANNGLPLRTLNNVEDFNEALAGVKKQKELDWNAKMLEARFDLGQKRDPDSFYFERLIKDYSNNIFLPTKEIYSVLGFSTSELSKRIEDKFYLIGALRQKYFNP